MSIMEKIAEVNAQLDFLRLQIKQRDERIAKLEALLERVISTTRTARDLTELDCALDLICEEARALLDPTP